MKFPDHFPDDPHGLEDTQAAVHFVLHGMTAAVQQATPPAAAVPVVIPTITVKAEDTMTSSIDALAQAIVKALSTQNVM